MGRGAENGLPDGFKGRFIESVPAAFFYGRTHQTPLRVNHLFLVPAVRCVVERKVRGPLPIEPVVRGNALAVLLFFGGLFSVFQFWPGGWNAFEAAEVPAGALVGEAFFI